MWVGRLWDEMWGFEASFLDCGARVGCVGGTVGRLDLKIIRPREREGGRAVG